VSDDAANLAADPSEEAPKVDDLAIKRERSEEAARLMDPNGVFMLSVRGVRIRWYQQLMEARDRETKDYLTSKLQVLDEVSNALQGFVNDYKVALRNKR
jgi:hypothetical protein